MPLGYCEFIYHTCDRCCWDYKLVQHAIEQYGDHPEQAELELLLQSIDRYIDQHRSHLAQNK